MNCYYCGSIIEHLDQSTPVSNSFTRHRTVRVHKECDDLGPEFWALEYEQYCAANGIALHGDN